MTFKTVFTAAICLALPACAQDTAETPAAQTPDAIDQITTDILGSEGTPIGNLNLRQSPHGVLIRVELGAGSLTPGWHGLHLHQVGDCSDTGVYKLSGGHVGKIENGHGLMNPNGPEGGDTPNIHAGPDGSAAMEIITARVSLADLADADGSALIIHAAEDDHITQPIGGAGPRVACAVIAS